MSRPSLGVPHPDRSAFEVRYAPPFYRDEVRFLQRMLGGALLLDVVLWMIPVLSTTAPRNIIVPMASALPMAALLGFLLKYTWTRQALLLRQGGGRSTVGAYYRWLAKEGPGKGKVKEKWKEKGKGKEEDVEVVRVDLTPTDGEVRRLSRSYRRSQGSEFAETDRTFANYVTCELLVRKPAILGLSIGGRILVDPAYLTISGHGDEHDPAVDADDDE